MTRAVDLTDPWMQKTDPENERGEVCTGYFTNTGKLKKLTVQDGGLLSVLQRPIALLLLGTDETARLERLVARNIEEEII